MSRVWIAACDSLLFERKDLGRNQIQLFVSSGIVVCDGTHHLSKEWQGSRCFVKQHGVLDMARDDYCLVGVKESPRNITRKPSRESGGLSL